MSTSPIVADIELRKLTKDFGRGRGVFDIDLTVARGGVVGFIGPNGSGKTTTIRMLLDLIRPDRGDARVFGHDARAHGLEIRRRVGYVPGELPQYGSLRVAEIVGLLANLRGGVSRERITALAERFGLDLGARYRDLSHGNKQKVSLVQAFMHEPALLILDEPTLGLDPVMQEQFRELIRERVSSGATAFLSSHVLSEVEELCDRIVIIVHGRIVREGTLAELRASRIHRVEILLESPVPKETLADLVGLGELVSDGTRILCSIRGSFGPLLQRLAPFGIREIDSRELTLDELFLAQYAADAQP
jgi:ABC-2 type transport system ATP-binding protein